MYSSTDTTDAVLQPSAAAAYYVAAAAVVHAAAAELQQLDLCWSTPADGTESHHSCILG